MLKVTPKATTTYTLTVTGVNGTLTKTVTVNVAGTTPVAATASVPLISQRHSAHRRRQAGSDRRLRLRRRRGSRRTAARRCTWLAAANADVEARRREVPRRPRPRRHRAVLDLHAAGRSADVHGPVLRAVLQAPKHLIVLHEYLHLSRTITLDGSPHPTDPDPFWMGHSIGRWDGDTLVVDSVGFKESEINGYQDDRGTARRRTLPPAESRDARVRSGDRGPERLCRSLAHHAHVPVPAGTQPGR